MLTLLQDKMDTPLGPLWVLCDEQFNLRAVEWDEHRDRMETLLDVHYRREGYQRVDCRNPGGLSSKLSDYFAGDLAIIELCLPPPPAPLFSARSGRRYAISLVAR